MKNKIINFHDVRDMNWFEKSLNILMRKFNLVSTKDIENFFYNGKSLSNSCHITIDDGDKTFYNVIYPVLKKMNVPATIFVSPEICSKHSNFWFQEIRSFDPDRVKKIICDNFNTDPNILKTYPVGVILKNMNINQIWTVINNYKSIYGIKLNEKYNMSIDQLREIDRDGLVTNGEHTMTHPILANETEDTSKKEITRSIKELENILQHEIKYFAYPNGTITLDYSTREMEILKNINCKLAFSMHAQNFNLNDNPLLIPRFGFSTGNRLFVLTKLILGKYWNSIKYLKSASEIESRIELKRKIDFNKLNFET
jgi:peptidoglycan/xylan/chitin deacetylase (PgdA/CDA1 family)